MKNSTTTESVKKKNGIVQFIIRFLQGMIIGTGGILPGVSGGAMCVIFGIYRPLMEMFAHPFKNLKKYFMLLLPVILGVGAGFVGLAGLVEMVMVKHEAFAVCVFIGLILGMVPQLFKDAGEKGRGVGAWISLVISTVVLGTLFIYLKYGSGISIVPNIGWYLFCGAVWGISIILPGMSSSSTLIFLGLYTPMLNGISHLKFDVLIPIIAGIGLVVALLSRGVNKLFEKFYAVAYHIILGAVIATTLPIIPTSANGVKDIVIYLVCFAAGFVVSLCINAVNQKYITKE
ncbi:MAG: DUF368 domain-containing protein [Clostridia bacterium]|nr:DUF368 domain-containing protein [Clostridia bacterium]